MAALWNCFTFNAPDITPQKSRGALVILCMAAKSQPRIINSHLQSVMDIGLGRRAREDPLLARYACIALQRLSDDDRVGLGYNHKIFSILSSLIIGPGELSQIFHLDKQMSLKSMAARSFAFQVQVRTLTCSFEAMVEVCMCVGVCLSVCVYIADLQPDFGL